MDHETISRKEKIELARRMADHGTTFRYKKTSYLEQNPDSDGQEPSGNYFFLRVLLSGFLLLAVLGVTRFDAMGEQQAQKYQTKLTKVLKNQTGVEYIKKVLKSVG